MSEIDPEKLADAIAYYDRDARPMEDAFYTILAAARAHLSTLPRVKEVEVWRVEWAIPRRDDDGKIVYTPHCDGHGSHELARHAAGSLGVHASCITITGPHKQRVPA